MAQFNSKKFNLYVVLWFATMEACTCSSYVSLAQNKVVVLPVFGGVRLAIAHLFCALPIACHLASHVRNRYPMHRFAFVIAGILTLVLPYSLEQISWALKQMDAGFMMRSFVRCAVCLTFVFVWTVSLPYHVSWKSKGAWSWTVLIWLILPAIYAWKHSELSLDEFHSSLEGMRIIEASQSLERSVELLGLKRINGGDIDDWLRKLKKETAIIEEQLASAMTDRSLNGYLKRGMQLMSLSRYTDAEQVLLEAKSKDPQIMLLLAISAREQKLYPRVEGLSRELLSVQPAEDVDGKRMIYQLLGEALVGQRKITATIAVYERAIQQCPKYCGEFEMRLGNVLGEAGDSAGAMEHFERAARAEPSLSKESENRIRGLRSNSCRF